MKVIPVMMPKSRALKKIAKRNAAYKSCVIIRSDVDKDQKYLLSKVATSIGKFLSRNCYMTRVIFDKNKKTSKTIMEIYQGELLGTAPYYIPHYEKACEYPFSASKDITKTISKAIRKILDYEGA